MQSLRQEKISLSMVYKHIACLLTQYIYFFELWLKVGSVFFSYTGSDEEKDSDPHHLNKDISNVHLND